MGKSRNLYLTDFKAKRENYKSNLITEIYSWKGTLTHTYA